MECTFSCIISRECKYKKKDTSNVHHASNLFPSLQSLKGALGTGQFSSAVTEQEDNPAFVQFTSIVS